MQAILASNKALRLLAYSLIFVALAGCVMSLTVFVFTGFEEGVFSLKLCFTDSCIKNFSSHYQYTLMIVSNTGSLLAGLVTFGGIAIALLSYVGTARASALNNHIAHMSIFFNYIYGEVDKRDRLSRSSFDVLKWYNLIYKNSSVGDVYVSENYKKFIAELNKTIIFSNELVSKKEDGGYRYTQHQRNVMDKLLEAGITLKSLPRLDFHEVEGQLFDLIKTINDSFCQSRDGFEIVERKYL